MQHAWARGVVHLDLNIEDQLADSGVAGRILLKWTCKKLNVEDWTKCMWLRIGTGS